jgi:tetratricopeptide (TPR) repeat protein
LIQQAREKSIEALKRSENSIDARLAIAMLDWQQTEQYAQADQKFRTLLKKMPNNWQIYHQYALLQLAMGKIQVALDLLNAASLRNPFSVTVKTDLARAHWFAGDIDRALNAAIRIRDKSDRHPLSVGLLVDIYEQQQDFSKAAAEHRSIEATTPEAYLSERRRRLEDLPYGPFGVELNAAILRSRTPKGIDSEAIADLVDSPRPPMLPLVLAMHPALEPARRFERSQEVLRRLGNTRDF